MDRPTPADPGPEGNPGPPPEATTAPAAEPDRAAATGQTAAVEPAAVEQTATEQTATEQTAVTTPPQAADAPAAPARPAAADPWSRPRESAQGPDPARAQQTAATTSTGHTADATHTDPAAPGPLADTSAGAPATPGPAAGTPQAEPSTGQWHTPGAWTGQVAGTSTHYGTWTPPAPAPAPEPEPPKPRDPLAVAVGNASLLGVGYFLVGKRVLGSGAALVSVALVVVLATAVPAVWFEFVVAAWWLFGIVHGWFLARGASGAGAAQPAVVRRQRITAVAVALPVLVVFGLLRFDAARIEGDSLDALDAGDCPGAVTGLDGVWVGHRVADAPMTVRADRVVEACGVVAGAEQELSAALQGDTDALRTGFERLSRVLADNPGHERAVRSALDGFLGGLPVADTCKTAVITDALRLRASDGSVLDRAREVVPKVAPAALVACGDTLMGVKSWEPARTRYQQLLDQYPGHELTAKAQEGVRKATLAIELAKVRSLLVSPGVGSQPAYCRTPAAYSGAAPYGGGKVMVFGNEFTPRLPAEWIATDAADAVAVVCTGDSELGANVDSCSYHPITGGGASTRVTFHNVAVPVKVYELRTGQLVLDTTVQIAGASCPEILDYKTTGGVDLGPPPDTYVAPTDADVHNAFRPVVVK